MIHKNILFGLPVYHLKINDELYNKKNILNVIKKNYDISSNRDNNSYGNLHHSFNDEKNNLDKLRVTIVCNLKIEKYE